MSTPAALPALVMPSALEALVTVVEQQTKSTAGSELHSSSFIPDPVPTEQLLMQIDTLWAHYLRVVEHTAASLAPTRSGAEDHSSGNVVKAELARMEECARRLQDGIRSKIQQTVRFEMVQALRTEVEERSHAVAKMQATLDSVKRQL